MLADASPRHIGRRESSSHKADLCILRARLGRRRCAGTRSRGAIPSRSGFLRGWPHGHGILGGACESRGLGGRPRWCGAADELVPVGKLRGGLSVVGHDRAWPAAGLAPTAPRPCRHRPPQRETPTLAGTAAARTCPPPPSLLP
jgi:hypothetical protein